MVFTQSSTSAFTSSGTGTLALAICTGLSNASSNGPLVFSTTNLASPSWSPGEPGYPLAPYYVAWRPVAVGFRIFYEGTALNEAGTYTVYHGSDVHDQGADSVGGQQILTSSLAAIGSYPRSRVYTISRSRPLQGFLTPSTKVGYRIWKDSADSSGLVHNGLRPAYVVIQGATASQVYRVQCVMVCELAANADSGQLGHPLGALSTTAPCPSRHVAHAFLSEPPPTGEPGFIDRLSSKVGNVAERLVMGSIEVAGGMLAREIATAASTMALM
jgi:hypothetical protein